MQATDVLKQGVRSYEAFLQDSGELHDPVFGEPSQYSTPYHALCNAVLASVTQDEARARYLERASRGLDAALRHVEDPGAPPHASGFDRETGSVTRLNHRDFFWPAILKTYRLVRDLTGPTGTPTSPPTHELFAARIAAVDIEASFRARPPSNWAAVWLSGEWLRLREGLSPHTAEQFDTWLGVFFETHIRLEQGLYQEPGHPNSYDLFTRYHLADILQEGYRGRHHEALTQLMETGLRRSLAVQLSDGSLASAHRSSGQTWTLGAQCAYFTHAANHVSSNPTLQHAAHHAANHAANQAARRALTALARYQRQDGPFSPVENCLPPGYRVGYETYTADAHYANLALGFLAVAIANGFDATPLEPNTPRDTLAHLEHDPTYRAVLHCGRYSVQLNALPAPAYDAFGLTDLTFGPGRTLHTSVIRHVASGRLYTLGMACRAQPGHAPLEVLSHKDYTLLRGFEPGDTPASVQLEGRAKGEVHTYRLAVHLDEAGVHVSETTPGRWGYKTLLVPYLRDAGTGVTTHTRHDTNPITNTVRLVHGDEQLELRLGCDIERVTVLPHGYESRRGLCGLIRVDLKGVLEGVDYHYSLQ